MSVNLNNMQRQTINSYNAVVRFLNSYQPDAFGKVEVDANKLSEKLREVHNNLAFFGGLVDDKSEKCYWEVNPEAEIKELKWEEEEIEA